MLAPQAAPHLANACIQPQKPNKQARVRAMLLVGLFGCLELGCQSSAPPPGDAPKPERRVQLIQVAPQSQPDGNRLGLVVQNPRPTQPRRASAANTKTASATRTQDALEREQTKARGRSEFDDNLRLRAVIQTADLNLKPASKPKAKELIQVAAPAGELLPNAAPNPGAQVAEPKAQRNQVPELFDAQGGLLPQTEARPGSDSAFFHALAEALFKAIVENNSELVLPYFMPLPVYEQLKDSKNPKRDWRFRLQAQLKRDIERYHRLLGRERAGAKLLGLEIKPEDALWMKPGREYNKLGYYRLFGSQLRYATARGVERRLEVTSLSSWRGEWYLVHLHGLK